MIALETPFRMLMKACALWACAIGAARAADTAEAPEWLTTADGAYVVHVPAKVAWPRCVEGMRWTGKRCQGQALHLSQPEALALARSRSQADGVTWRLPSLKELQRLAQQNVRGNAEAGARTPLLADAGDAWCWTGTAVVDTSAINEYSYGNAMRGVTAQNMARLQFLHAWAVNTGTAEARKDVLKRTLLNVRLVRTLD